MWLSQVRSSPINQIPLAETRIADHANEDFNDYDGFIGSGKVLLQLTSTSNKASTQIRHLRALTCLEGLSLRLMSILKIPKSKHSGELLLFLQNYANNTNKNNPVSKLNPSSESLFDLTIV